MEHLEKAEELESLALDITPQESEFIGSVLSRLRGGASLAPKQIKTLNEMYKKYLGDPEDEDEDGGSDEDEGVGEDDDMTPA